MEVTTLLFYVFSGILLMSALCVITVRNPVHAALYLVLAFFTAAGIWMLLRAEFLAITLVLVYVGAVMVLLLFVVMMLDVNLDQLRVGFKRNLPVAISVGAIIVFEMIAVILRSVGKLTPLNQTSPQLPAQLSAPLNTDANFSNTKALGRLLYTEYAFPFEIAALILLVGIIAAIALTLRHRKDTKVTDPSKQVKVKRADRIKLVSMPAEIESKQTGSASSKSSA